MKMMEGSSGTKAVANLFGGQSAVFQKQVFLKASAGACQYNFNSEEIIINESRKTSVLPTTDNKNDNSNWIWCAPCVWLRTSTTIHRIAITMATFLVTSLLVASPILFLLSTAPSQIMPKGCNLSREGCISTDLSLPECTLAVCRTMSSMIQSHVNWSIDPCLNFKEFSCSNREKRVSKTILSPQEAVNFEMQRILQHNTTSGPFRKLGRLFGSCLRQRTNSSAIRYIWEQLGGYLPIGALGPSSISPLISNINKLGPIPLIDIYYDLSYGKRPHVLLIISGPGLSAPILENKIRWIGPKAPPYRVQDSVPKLLNDLLVSFIPSRLSFGQKISEAETISTFIREFNKIRRKYSGRGFWENSMLFNTSTLQNAYPKFNWTNLIPNQWSGPIVVRSSEYLRSVEEIMEKYPTRVLHNSLLILFALGILPQDIPSPVICTRAVIWALPDITSALYVAQHYSKNLDEVVERSVIVFRSLKSHLKRAPSLKGAALVKLSALKIQSQIWPGFTNYTAMIHRLESLEISSHSWFDNVLNILKRNDKTPDASIINFDSQDAWAFPVLSNVFYDTLSHSIVVPLAAVMVPYFDLRLPMYLQYASVGVEIAKEILRSITKTFEEKALRCVPTSVHILSNQSRMDVLIHSGGMQIAYHAMLSLTGPIKGMERLPGLNLTPPQIYFLAVSQKFCTESLHAGTHTTTAEFGHILSWLVAQGGSATEVYKCPSGSVISSQKTCNVL